MVGQEKKDMKEKKRSQSTVNLRKRNNPSQEKCLAVVHVTSIARTAEWERDRKNFDLGGASLP